jgi:hypothetical protein
MDTVESRILAAGDRTSQVYWGLYEEFGNITRTEVALLLGIGRTTLYREAAKTMSFDRHGCRPTPHKKAA